MSEQLVNELTDILTSPDRADELSGVCDELYQKVLESLQNGLAEAAKKEILIFYDHEDWLAERLGLSDMSDYQGLARYYFGQIKAMADLLSDAADWEKEAREALELSKRFQYLSECLETIDRHELISGRELKKALNIKDSNFSNFVRRVESYHLFYIQKSGTSNYYSLTPRGRRCLLQNTEEKKARKMCSLSFLFALLDRLAAELEAGGQDADKVLLEANLRCEGGRLQGYDSQIRRALERTLKAEETRRRKRIAYSMYISKRKWACLDDALTNDLSFNMIEDDEFEPI